MHPEKTLVKEPESTALIRFQDCDPFGHLNNARYVDYFMDARQDQVAAHYGIQFFGEDMQESWVVSKSQIAFLAPALLMERVLIRTRVIHVTERTMVVEGLMLTENGRRLKAVLWAEFTYVSLRTGRPATHSEELMELFRSLVIDGAYDYSFEARIDYLRAQFRRDPLAQTEQANAA